MNGPHPYQSPSYRPAPSDAQTGLLSSDEFDWVCVGSITLSVASAVLALFALGVFVAVGPYEKNLQNLILMFALASAMSAIGVLFGIRAWCTGFRHAKTIISLNVFVFTFATIPLIFVADMVGIAIFG